VKQLLKQRATPGWIQAIVWGVFLVSVSGCHQVNITDDFKRPYEAEELLLPAATHFYNLSGPRGVAVDIAIDFDESKLKSPPQLAVVSSEGPSQIGVRVPGSPMRRAVCGVPLDPEGGVRVVVQNQNLLRSIPFSLRIEQAPSLICSPQTAVPSMVLVQRFP
jgi:hypothetical protein